MSSSTFSPSASDPESRALAICGWSALALLVAAVLTFGAARHLGWLEPADPLAAELALHRQLNRIAQDLGLSTQADTRAGELEKDPAKLAALRGEIAELLRQHPRSPRALFYQALERLAARDFPAAQAAAASAAEIDPLNLSAWLVLGAAAFEAKNYPEAEKAFRRAIEIEPKALSAYDNLGQTLWLMDRRDEATAVYRRRAQVEGLPLVPEKPPAPAAPPAKN